MKNSKKDLTDKECNSKVMLQWKIVNEELPKNNGHGVSNLCLVYALSGQYELSRYVFYEDVYGYWESVVPSQQDSVQLWAYIPKLPIDIINKILEKY